MSKNNLLNEGTIRRFMKLANVDALTDTFVEKITEASYEVEEQDPPAAPLEEMGMEHGTYGARDDEMDVEVDVVDVEDEDEAPVGDEEAAPEAPAEGDVVSLAKAVLDAVERAVNEVVPGLVSLEDDDEVPMDEPMPPVDEPLDVPAEEEMMEAPEAPVEETITEEEPVQESTEETIEEVNVVEDEDLINEVAKRVTARLVKSLAARKNS